jgi:sec-independent protein translocase protein TatA
MYHTLAFVGMPQGAEWLVIAALGLLFFGKRLPEVGRSLGHGIVEFKKGLKGVQDEVTQVDESIDDQAAANRRLPDQTTATSAAAGKPKFDPYTGKPMEEEEAPKTRFDPYTGKPLEETTEQK